MPYIPLRIICSQCKQYTNLNRTRHRRDLCDSCYSVILKPETVTSSTHVHCNKCKKIKRRYARNLCRNCYEIKYHGKRLCTRCGKIKYHVNTKDLCKECRQQQYNHRIAPLFNRPAPRRLIECTVCKEIRPISGYDMCVKCYTKFYRMRNPNYTPLPQFSFEGESKSLTGWSKDPRCEVSYWTLRHHVRKLGMPLEEALRRQRKRGSPSRANAPQSKTQQPRLIEIFGEKKSLFEWSRDPRCQVKQHTLAKRLRQGVSPEDALKERESFNMYEVWKQRLLAQNTKRGKRFCSK